MKVAELEGALLDYWVARANGWRVNPDFSDGGWRYLNEDPREIYPCEWHNKYKPSTDWEDGGPIIERAIAQLEHSSNDPGLAWNATNDDGDVFWADTALVAAMRAYVASKFGEEVPAVD